MNLTPGLGELCKKCFLLLSICCLCIAPHSQAFGASQSNIVETNNFQNEIYVSNSDIRDLIEAYSRRNALKFVLTDDVKGRVSNLWLPRNMKEFFDAIAPRFRLQWYLDGNTLRVSHMSNNVSRILPLGHVSYERLKQKLIELNLFVPEFPIRHSAEGDLIVADGPVSFVARLEVILSNLTENSGKVSVIKFGMRKDIAF